MRLGVGVPTYNGWKRVEKLLRSILKREISVSPADIPILLHDDGTPGGKDKAARLFADGGPVQELRRRGFPVDTSWSPRNRGIAASWNALARGLFSAGAADAVLLLNDDILLSDGWADAVLYFLQNNRRVGTVYFNQFFFEARDADAILEDPDPKYRVDPLTREYFRELWTCDAVGATPAPVGSAFAFTRRSFEWVGGFPEHFVSFHEESHFGMTLAKEGLMSFAIPEPVVWHQWSAAFRENPELEARKTMARSRALFCRAWGVPPAYATRPFDWVHPRVTAHWKGQKVCYLYRGQPRTQFVGPCACAHCKAYREFPDG